MNLAAVVTVVVTLITTFPAGVVNAQSPRQDEKNQSRKKLQEQQTQWEEIRAALADRVKAVRDLVNLHMRHYQTGTVDFETLNRSLHQLRVAEYELARVFGTEEERQSTLQRSRRLAIGALELVRAKADAGVVSRADVFQAEALLAEAKIAILRDRMTGGAPFPRVPEDLYPDDDRNLPDTPLRVGSER